MQRRVSSPCGRKARSAVSVLVGLAFVSAPGCYLSHRNADDAPSGTDDGGLHLDANAPLDAASDAPDPLDAEIPTDASESCAPPGSYDTPLRVLLEEPEGCAGVSPDTQLVTFPFENNFAVDTWCEGGLTLLGPCEWRVSYVCSSPLPGYGSTVTGVIGMRDRQVVGRLELEVSSDPGGVCRVTTLLGNAMEPF